MPTSVHIEAEESFTAGIFCFLLKTQLFSSILISRWLRINSVIDKDLFTCLSPKKHFLSLRATINYRSSIYVAGQPTAQLVL